jgi:signal transduction histidine kinase/HAMP domain-containing protein
MFGIRQKLFAALAGLLAILLLVSALAIAVTSHYRSALDIIYDQNWRSVQYGQNVVDALDQLQDSARDLLSPQATAADLSAARADLAKRVAVIDRNIDDENHNITIDGEADLAASLTRLWSGPAINSCRVALTQLADSTASRAATLQAFDDFERLAPQVKYAAQAVINLNLGGMKPLNGQSREKAADAIRAMILLAGAGAALAALFMAIIGRTILRPIRTLTNSIREIERGNLDLVVQVKTRDELRQLAEAFNSMAGRLRDYRRTNQARLVSTQQTMQLAINSLPDGVALLSPEGTVEMANTSATQLFGLRSGSRVPELGLSWLAELYQAVCADLRPVQPRGYESTVQLFDEHGHERIFLPQAVPILDDQRQLLGITIVLADVTNLRRLDEMKSGLLSVVSHELKTPLTSMRMGVHLLLEERIGALTAQQNDILIAMRDDSDRLSRIIDNLLDIGRIESGKALVDLAPTPAGRLVNDAVASVSTAFRERGIELQSTVAPDVPDVLADPAKIAHVFNNLLSNALRYTPAGGQVRVSAEFAEQDTMAPGNSQEPDGGARTVRFKVQDSGSGIPREYLDRVFERFFRVPGQLPAQGASDGSPHAGLGLAISREIVEAHGGHISVQSQPGQGSTFSFALRTADLPANSTGLSPGSTQDAGDGPLIPMTTSLGHELTKSPRK